MATFLNHQSQVSSLVIRGTAHGWLMASLWLMAVLLCLQVSDLQAKEASAAEPAPADRLQAAREEAVLLARAGELDAALLRLRNLLQAYPDDPPLIADALTVLDWAGSSAEAAQLAERLVVPEVPDWAWLPWARALRDLGRYDDALQVLAQARNQWPAAAPERLEEPVLRALILADAGQHAQAIATIERARATPGVAEVPAALAAAYVYRRAGDPGRSLQASQWVLNRHPDQPEAWQHQVFALLELGAARRALELGEARPDLFSASDMARLQLARAAQQLGWAREADGQPGIAHAEVRAVAIAAAEALAELRQTMPDTAPELVTDVEQEYLLALFQQGDYAAVRRLYQQLSEQAQQVDGALRTGVHLAAADAALHDDDPEAALALYDALLADDPWLFEARIGRYWALIDSGQYHAAQVLIDELTAEKPTHLPGADGGPGPRYWRRLELDLMAAMHRAMANRPDLAQARLERLLEQAPASAQIMRELATVYRWRGWSTRALALNGTALYYEPDVVNGQLQNLQLRQDLGQYQHAADGIAVLYQHYPDVRAVQRARRDVEDRRRWGLSSSAEYGDSDGFADTGSRDRSLFTRVHGPRLAHHWQVYGWHYYSDAQFPEGSARYDRLAAGLDWGQGPHTAYVEAHTSRVGSTDPGVTLGYAYRWGDHWRFTSRFDSFSTDVPLRAYNQGIDGWRLQAGAEWRAHESRRAQLGLGYLDLSDGNARLSLNAGAEQRVLALPEHQTRVRVDLYGSRASQEGGPYFNPQRDASLGAGAEHQWLTWRDGRRTLTQHFRLGVGGYWQDGFGTEPTADLGYAHHWQLTRLWRVNYGLGWSARAYDGNRERRWYGRLGIEGLF